MRCLLFLIPTSRYNRVVHVRTWRKYQDCLFVFSCSTSIFRRICKSSKQANVGNYLPSSGVPHEYLLKTHLKLTFIEAIISCSKALKHMQMYSGNFCDSLWPCISLRDSTWLCMTLNDSVWLCITLYNFAWLTMNLHDSEWLCMTPCDFMWFCVILHDFVSCCVIRHGSAWLSMTPDDCMTLPDFVRLCMTLRESAWLCVTLRDSAWLGKTWRNPAWLCLTLNDSA
jgi:hypothetical protein